MSTNCSISGKIGKKELIRENISTFVASLKDLEWTNNPIYRSAKYIDFKPSFPFKTRFTSKSYREKINPYNIFHVDDSYLINDEFHSYQQQCQNRYIAFQHDVENKKKDFISNFLSNDISKECSDWVFLMERIKQNRAQIIQRDKNLKSKLEQYFQHAYQRKTQYYYNGRHYSPPPYKKFCNEATSNWNNPPNWK